MIIMNAFSEATLRNTFATAELKDVRGLPIKLHLTLVQRNWFDIVSDLPCM